MDSFVVAVVMELAILGWDVKLRGQSLGHKFAVERPQGVCLARLGAELGSYLVHRCSAPPLPLATWSWSPQLGPVVVVVVVVLLLLLVTLLVGA